jgi:glycosyltransferase involved in cell wall biosynthesis
MQGIINGIEPYEYGSLPIGNMLISLHPVKMLVAVTMILNKVIFFNPRLPKEKETIRKAKNILGRTNWDRAHTYAINSAAPYFGCNRILRGVFYEQQWDIKNIRRRTIFIGNAASPLKGAHFVLESLALLKREFPDVKLYIAGEHPFYSSLKDWKKAIGYKAYLRYLIKKLDVADNIEFTGILQAEQMAARLLDAHVYVMASVIENSPNTLGEAMILGVPSVTSYSGGTPDMAVEGQEALFYRDNDSQLLAYQIKRIFDDDILANHMSANARHRAKITHDPKRNLGDLLQIYRTILSVENDQEQ